MGIGDFQLNPKWFELSRTARHGVEMTPFDFFETVQRAQKEFDTRRLALGGVNHWMVVRLLMLAKLAEHAARGTHTAIGKGSHSRMIDNPLAALERSEFKSTHYATRAVGKSCLLLSPPMREAPIDSIVFYELPVDYTRVSKGHAVNRIADGFVEAFGKSVRKVCRFEMSLFRSKCRFDPTFVVLAPSEQQLPYEDRARFMVAVLDFCAYLAEAAPDFALTPSKILTAVRLVLREAASHDAWLADLQPKAVAFQCYASMEKMGVLVACKRLGIPSIEVQHGYCDRSSIFNEMPMSTDSSFALMPDLFWTWGEMTLEALMEDSGFSKNGVQLALGGDVWGALANQDIDNEVDELLTRVNARSYNRRVLIGYQVETLVKREEDGMLMPSSLIDAMRNGPDTWLWMIRVHPRSSHLIEPVTDMLHTLGIKNFEVVNSTMEPIEVVLQASDCYVTGFSVSALEANAIGKPVFIVDEIGRRLFSALIEDGVFAFAESSTELIGLVRALKPPSRNANYYTRDLSVSRKVFEGIMAGKRQSEIPSGIESSPAGSISG